MLHPLEEARALLRIFVNNGYDAYIVGGAVRDLELGRPVADIDIATAAKPEAVMALFEKTVPVGIEHGTVLVRFKQKSFEVTTFRSEGQYSDFRRPESVQFEASIYKDLERRDFTINAMAMNVEGEIIDPYGGKQALREQKLRTVGPASERFEEDALRMLRAVRFIAQLGLTPDDETVLAIKQQGDFLQHIAIERIHTEFEKLLGGDFASKGLGYLIQTGLYKALPFLAENLEALQELKEHPLSILESSEERWAHLLFAMGQDDTQSFYRSWRFSKREKKRTERLIHIVQRMKNVEWSKQILFQTGLTDALAANRIALTAGQIHASKKETIHDIWEDMPVHELKEIKMDGKDLCHQLDKQPGPWVAEALNHLANAILTKEVDNERTLIGKWVSTCLKQKIKF